MFNAINEQVVTLQVPNPAAASATYAFFKAPRAGTIVAAYASSQSGVLTATPLTTFLSASLLNGNTTGTGTATIATWGSAATPYTWTANQGYQATFDTTSNKDVAANQWVMFRHEGIALTTLQGVLSVAAHVVLGTGRVT